MAAFGYVRRGVLAVMGATFLSPRGAHVSLPRDACELAQSRQRLLSLTEGARWVTLHADGLARGRHAIAATSMNTLVWSRNGAQVRINDHEAIGIVLDAHGRLLLIPSPFVKRRILYPRIEASADGRWNILFATSSDTASLPAIVQDSVVLWHGIFDGQRWQRITRIARAQHAMISASQASQLVGNDRHLAFAYGFSRPAVAPDQSTRGVGIDRGTTAGLRGGVVLVQRVAGHWRSDTLLLHRPPNYVVLGLEDPHGASDRHTPDRLWIGLVQPDFDGIARPSTLFVATHDSAWGQLRRLTRYERDPVMSPAIDLLRGSVVLTWVHEASGQRGHHSLTLESTRLSVGQHAGEASAVVIDTIANGPGVEDFSSAPVDSITVAWLWRDRSSRDTVRASMARGGERFDLGRVAIPLDNPSPRAIAEGPGALEVISSRMSYDGVYTQVNTMVTSLSLVCTQRQ